jgi:hypothetical protein
VAVLGLMSAGDQVGRGRQAVGGAHDRKQGGNVYQAAHMCHEAVVVAAQAAVWVGCLRAEPPILQGKPALSPLIGALQYCEPRICHQFTYTRSGTTR